MSEVKPDRRDPDPNPYDFGYDPDTERRDSEAAILRAADREDRIDADPDASPVERAVKRTMAALLTAEAKRRLRAEKWARVGWILVLVELLALAGILWGMWKG